MYNRGLETFLHAKKLKSRECINAFLKSQGITEFTSVHHNRVNSYIEANWLKFASFVDRGIKAGTLKGKAVKLNYYYDEQRERKELAKKEFSTLTREEVELYQLIRDKDDITRFSKVSSYTSKLGYKLPKNNDAISRALRVLPKIQFIKIMD